MLGGRFRYLFPLRAISPPRCVVHAAGWCGRLSCEVATWHPLRERRAKRRHAHFEFWIWPSREGQSSHEMPFDPTRQSENFSRELAAKLPASMSLLLGLRVEFEMNQVACQPFSILWRQFFFLLFLNAQAPCGCSVTQKKSTLQSSP